MTHSQIDSLLELRGVSWDRGTRRELLRALDDVSLEVRSGEVLAVVGSSGSGKSSLLRILAGLDAPTTGQVLFAGSPWSGRLGRGNLEARASIQWVSQQVHGSFRSNETVHEALETPLRLHNRGMDADEIEDRLHHHLAQVLLLASHLHRRVRSLSVGEAQRVAVARALTLAPRVLLLDEPTSALDASLRRDLVTMLAKLRSELDVTIVLATHDFHVVRHLADRVATMLLGRIVEVNSRPGDPSAARHPWSLALWTQGDEGPSEPRGEDRASPCPVAKTCPRRVEACQQVRPTLTRGATQGAVACHHPLGADMPTDG